MMSGRSRLRVVLLVALAHRATWAADDNRRPHDMEVRSLSQANNLRSEVLRRLVNTDNDTTTTTNVTTTQTTTTITTATTITTTTNTTFTTTSAKKATTTGNTTTTAAGALGSSGSDSSSSDDSSILPIILVSIVGALLLLTCIVIGFLHVRRSSVEKHEAAILELDRLQDEFSAAVSQLKEVMAAQNGYVDRFISKQASGEPINEEKHLDFQQRWNSFISTDNAKFEDDYAREKKKRKQTPKGFKPGSLFRPQPVTPLSVVRMQMEALQSLRYTLDGIIHEYPDLNSELDIKAPPVPEAPPARSTGSGAVPDLGLPTLSFEKEPGIEQQIELLRHTRHPLLRQCVVKPYGVLGNSESERDPEPHKPLDAVIVDPAGWYYIGSSNNPRGAGGASGSIYRWLGISRGNGTFPAEVHSHFQTSREEDAETRAKYHCYSQGQHAIHAVGPKIYQLQDALAELARTYTNVFSEFCKALEGDTNNNDNNNEKTAAPKILRLLPISSGIFLVNKKLDRYMPQLSWSAMSLACASLPSNYQEQLKSCSIEMCIFLRREVKDYESILAKKQALLKDGSKLNVDMGTLASKEDGFNWIRLKNGPVDRLERLRCFLVSEEAILNGGYTFPGNKVVTLSSTEELLRGTRIRRAGDPMKGQPATGRRMEVIGDDAATVMEVAMRCQRDNKKVVGVSAAAAYNAGGGVLTGGRHALEESWCIMSTLLKSLLHVKFQNSEIVIHSGYSYVSHIPVDGCIVSPGVEIFRETSADGYKFLESPTKLHGVVSMAMFNMNPRLNDSPQDAPRDFTEYCRQVKQKFVALVSAAAETGAEVLVCPDIGCGVFENDPTIVGTLFGEALAETPRFFSEVWITGKVSFFESALKTSSGEKVKIEVPPYYFTSGQAHEWECPIVAGNSGNLLPNRSSSSYSVPTGTSKSIGIDPLSSMIVHRPSGAVGGASVPVHTMPSTSTGQPASMTSSGSLHTGSSDATSSMMVHHPSGAIGGTMYGAGTIGAKQGGEVADRASQESQIGTQSMVVHHPSGKKNYRQAKR